MGERSSIEWTSGSWNPWQGCLRVSLGCTFCYAETLAKRRGVDFGTVVRSKTTFNDPLRWQRKIDRGELPKGYKVFTCSISDFFIKQADPWREEAWEIMRQTPDIIYQVLTKRPSRMVTWANKHGWLPNVWAGVSVENAKYLYRLKSLYEMKCRIPQITTFMSGEPLLGSLDGLASYLKWQDLDKVPLPAREHFRPCLDLVIVGGESGPGARPMEIAWLESIVSQCRSAGVPVFVKQDSGPRSGMQGRIPDELWAMKEMPNA